MKDVTKNKVWDIVEDYNCDKLLYLLIDRPDAINILNEHFWKNNRGENHRDYDLPAMFFVDKNILWRKNNKKYRNNNKPAIIKDDGFIYFCKGKFIYKIQ